MYLSSFTIQDSLFDSSNVHPIQTTLYYEEVALYASGSAYAALGSQLATELPNSIYTKENSIGFAGLSTEYGSSFTLQSWYSDVIAVHTQVENALESIFEDVATKLVNATFTSTSPTAIRTPTTAAATVTQASSTFATTTGLVVATGGPGGTAGTAAASQQSTAAAAQVTAAAHNVLGYGAVAVGGIVGALML